MTEEEELGGRLDQERRRGRHSRGSLSDTHGKRTQQSSAVTGRLGVRPVGQSTAPGNGEEQAFLDRALKGWRCATQNNPAGKSRDRYQRYMVVKQEALDLGALATSSGTAGGRLSSSHTRARTWRVRRHGGGKFVL